MTGGACAVEAPRETETASKPGALGNPPGCAWRIPVYWPGGARRRGGVSLVCGSCTEREKASVDTAARVAACPGWPREGACRGGNRRHCVPTRRSPAYRPVVAVNPLLSGVAGEPRGRLTRDVRFDQPGLRPREESREHAKAQGQAVCDSQADGEGGVPAGRGQQGRPGGGRGDPGRVRGRSGEQPLPDLEPDELGVVLPAPGASSGDPQAPRRRGPRARRAHDRTLQERDRGTPQGSAVSPVLANLFLHYAFDQWMARKFPGCPFERYADDAVVHCKSRRQAEYVRDKIAQRMREVGLRLHPDKTRIVYCCDSSRRGEHEQTSFTFLGYAFRPREAVNGRTGEHFTSFLPAISPEALKAASDRLRALRIHRRTDLSLDDLARWLNPIVAGWMNYYGRYYRSEMYPLLRRVSLYLRRWAGKKYRRLRTYKRFKRWWAGLLKREPGLFAHWRWVRAFGSAGEKSPVTGDCHAGICGSRGLRCPRPPAHTQIGPGGPAWLPPSRFDPSGR